MAHADPAAELPAAIVALRGRVCLRSQRGERWVAAEDFLKGWFSTALAEDEVLTAVEVTVDPEAQWGFWEVARRVGDFALAGAYAKRVGDLAEVTWFAIGPKPIRVAFSVPEAARAVDEALAEVEDAVVRQWAKVSAQEALKRTQAADARSPKG